MKAFKSDVNKMKEMFLSEAFIDQFSLFFPTNVNGLVYLVQAWRLHLTLSRV